MPSGSSPRCPWYRRSATAVRLVNRPSTARAPSPCRRSRNSSTATSHPTAPMRSSRCPRSGRPRVPSARRVARPTRAVGRIPLFRWNAIRAFLVNGPRTPSTGPGLNPWARRPIWSAATRALAASPEGTSARTPMDTATPTTAKRRMVGRSRPAVPVLPQRRLEAPATISRLPSPVAQLAEHPAVNRRVVGSSPTRGAAKYLQSAQNDEGASRGALFSYRTSYLARLVSPSA